MDPIEKAFDERLHKDCDRLGIPWNLVRTDNMLLVAHLVELRDLNERARADAEARRRYVESGPHWGGVSLSDDWERRIGDK